MLGRDWILVKRRKPTKLGIIGAGLAVLGVAGLIWGSIQDFHPERVGIFLAVIGLGIVGYQRLETRLETRNLAQDEIYNVGRERGEAEGYQQGYDDRGMEHPVRPVLVPLHLRCVDCGGTRGLQPVGSVADRG
jgi:hypothetical protein